MELDLLKLQQQTLEPGGLFKHYDPHKVQPLKISFIVQMDTLSLYLLMAQFIQEIAKPSKETPGGDPAKTFFQIVCGIWRYIEEKNEKVVF